VTTPPNINKSIKVRSRRLRRRTPKKWWCNVFSNSILDFWKKDIYKCPFSDFHF
jgi:hypothetical protein